MTDRIDENPPMSIGDQAAEWFLRWHAGDLNIADRFAYLQWLKTSPVHIAETLRVCRMYSWLSGTKLNIFVTNEDSYSNIVELAPREKAASSESQHVGEWRGRIAAAVTVLCVSALLAFGAKVAWLDHIIRTEATEWRTLPLDDESVVSVGPRTNLRHDLGGTQRLLQLSEGEALFNVFKDPKRPFLVDAGLVTVRATGTQFAVDHRPAEVVVTVREGSVLVIPNGNSNLSIDVHGVPLKAGEQITVSRFGTAEPRKVDTEKALAWSSRRLIFEDDTLDQAVGQFNRRNRVQIMLDPLVRPMAVRGVFEADDPGSFAEMLEHSAKLKVIREGPNRVRVEGVRFEGAKQRGE